MPIFLKFPPIFKNVSLIALAALKIDETARMIVPPKNKAIAPRVTLIPSKCPFIFSSAPEKSPSRSRRTDPIKSFTNVAAERSISFIFSGSPNNKARPAKPANIPPLGFRLSAKDSKELAIPSMPCAI